MTIKVEINDGEIKNTLPQLVKDPITERIILEILPNLGVVLSPHDIIGLNCGTNNCYRLPSGTQVTLVQD